MNIQNPDKWIIIGKEGCKDFKVLAGWVGGYTAANIWRLSSGVTNVESKDDFYMIHNVSGSVYKCAKRAEGFTSLTGSVFESIGTMEDALRTFNVEECKDLLLSKSNIDKKETK